MIAAKARIMAALALLAPACAVYDAELFDGEGSGEESAAGNAGTGSSGGSSAGGVTIAGSGSGGTSSATGGSSSVAGTSSSAGLGSTPSSGGTSNSGAGGGLGGFAGFGGCAVAGGGPGPSLSLVDDFETPDELGVYADGRKPRWYMFNDQTAGTQLPAAFELTAVLLEDAALRPGSAYALQTSSSAFTAWGSGVGVDLANESGKVTHDLSGFVGVSFYAKSPSSYRVIRVNVPDVGTDPTGQICMAAQCADHFGALVSLTGEWKRYDIYFSDMAQQGWGLERDALSVDQVYSIHFLIAKDKSVELWVDDLALIAQ